MKNTTNNVRFAYQITYKRPRGRKVFVGIQYHPNRTSALGTNIEGMIVKDAQKLTEEQAKERNVPYSVEVS